MSISFAATKKESETIRAIVDRWIDIILEHDPHAAIDRESLEMDITACHCNGNPLRLQDLLESDRLDFSHDVFGIHRHIDRDTGKLTQYFVPPLSNKSTISLGNSDLFYYPDPLNRTVVFLFRDFPRVNILLDLKDGRMSSCLKKEGPWNISKESLGKWKRWGKTLVTGATHVMLTYES